MKGNGVTSSLKNSVWRNTQFIYLWTGTSLSNLTFHVFTLALPLLVYEMSRSTFAMGVLRGVEIIPNILLGIFIGVLVDRFHRKRIMFFAVLTQLLSVSVIIMLSFFSSLQLWMLYGLALFLYISIYTFSNAYHTTLPEIVDKKLLTSANSIITFTNTFINIIGPSFAGIILFYTTYHNGLLITVLGFIILMVLLSVLKIPDNKKSKRGHSSFWKDVKEGWDQLVSTRTLWLATWMILGINMALAASSTVLIFYALDTLKVGNNVVGYVLTGSGLGGMIGAYTAKALGRITGRGKLFISLLLVASFGQFILFLSNQWYWLAIGMLFMGYAATTINIHYLTLRQLETPGHLLGRVAGTSSMIMKLAMPISFLSVGAIGEFIPVHYVFLGSSIMLIVLFFLLANSPLKNLI